jgi:hypothetical protein
LHYRADHASTKVLLLIGGDVARLHDDYCFDYVVRVEVEVEEEGEVEVEVEVEVVLMGMSFIVIRQLSDGDTELKQPNLEAQGSRAKARGIFCTYGTIQSRSSCLHHYFCTSTP